MQRRHELGGDDLTVAAGDSCFYGFLEDIGCAKQHVHDRDVDRQVAAANAIEHRFQLVRQFGDDGVTHRRAHAFDRMNATKDRRDGGGRTRSCRIALELEQRLVDSGDVLSALGEKELRVLGVIHDDACAALSPTRAARPRARDSVETV